MLGKLFTGIVMLRLASRLRNKKAQTLYIVWKPRNVRNAKTMSGSFWLEL